MDTQPGPAERLSAPRASADRTVCASADRWPWTWRSVRLASDPERSCGRYRLDGGSRQPDTPGVAQGRADRAGTKATPYSRSPAADAGLDVQPLLPALLPLWAPLRHRCVTLWRPGPNDERQSGAVAIYGSGSRHRLPTSKAGQLEKIVTKLPAIAIGAAPVAPAAAATAAASPKTHKMDVALPGGSVAHIEYVGDVAPKVTVDPRPMADAAGAWGMPFPSFAAFDRMMADMQRQSAQMRAQITARQAAGAAPYIADFGKLSAGEMSTTV